MKLRSLHEVLVAWQAGDLDYRQALSLAQIETLDELYEAAAESEVAINPDLGSTELREAQVVASLIRGQARPRAA